MMKFSEGIDAKKEITEPGNERQNIDGAADSTDETRENKKINEAVNCREKDESENRKNEKIDGFRKGLTDDEREKIRKENIFSDPRIIDSMRSFAEYEIFKNIGLIEKEIGNRMCLIRKDIDWGLEFVRRFDANGNAVIETNRQRAARGEAPFYYDGNKLRPIELHHIGQRADSCLAELTPSEHRGKANYKILHDPRIKSEVHGAGSQWNNEGRPSYWKLRLAEVDNE